MKIRPVAADVSHAGGHDEAFHNFANARRNGIHTQTGVYLIVAPFY